MNFMGQQEFTSPQAESILKVIRILGIVQVCLGIFTLFVDIFSGIIVLLNAAFLFMIICLRNWCICIVYIILALMDIFSSIVLVGDYFTEEDGEISDVEGTLVVLSLLKIPFYFVSIYYAFLAYRELKGLFVENVFQGVPGYGAVDPPPNQEPRIQPFAGVGHRLG